MLALHYHVSRGLLKPSIRPAAPASSPQTYIARIYAPATLRVLQSRSRRRSLTWELPIPTPPILPRTICLPTNSTACRIPPVPDPPHRPPGDAPALGLTGPSEAGSVRFGPEVTSFRLWKGHLSISFCVPSRTPEALCRVCWAIRVRPWCRNCPGRRQHAVKIPTFVSPLPRPIILGPASIVQTKPELTLLWHQAVNSR